MDECQKKCTSVTKNYIQAMPASLSINYAWGSRHEGKEKGILLFLWLSVSSMAVQKLTEKKINTQTRSVTELHLDVLADSQRGADTCFHGWLHSSPRSPEGRACLPCPGWCRHQWIAMGWPLQFPWTLWGPPAPILPLLGGKSPQANGGRRK